eukprot:CAMPEP_0175880152 /NCGR_PEP_ID=MMETSP0107_2-20121207/42160_1 /TAXON_ID=195067 ORGANISM="Goniomonas pacifica, Strain CCMP1869" /NCGR_SAMPLE_ID=MMETSP0107_2 /ASSEMBLY_ACC=CAM_ASM_000203 /LENGTH=133 /DNA_ID=CAMNT_0017199867 /DNA_START=142 /DNA_END=543 /DNA_ORIENTATION=+
MALCGHSNAVTSVAFSPDGGLIASASFDTRYVACVAQHTVKIWDTMTGAERSMLLGNCPVWLHDTSLAVCCDDEIRLVSLGQRDVVRASFFTRGHDRFVTSMRIAACRKGPNVVLATGDKSSYVYIAVERCGW